MGCACLNAAPFNKEPPTNFEGLYGKHLSNPSPKGNVPVGKGQTPTDPFPDPGEPYEDVYEQLYNTPCLPLNKTPAPPSASPEMQGFVNNYARINSRNPEIIMNCFTPSLYGRLDGYEFADDHPGADLGLCAKAGLL